MTQISPVLESPKLSLRRLTSDDVISYNQLRLTALKNHPENFACDFESEERATLSEKKERLTDGIYIGMFEGDTLIGSVSLHVEKHQKLRHKGHVCEMFVDERKRSRGIGRNLLTELIRVAKQQGLTTLMLAVWQQNEPAIRLYTSLGFTILASEPRALIMPDGTFVDEYLMTLAI